ncbi:DUF6221 family protein [Actinomadura litoris]|uniref:Uncharacterized protein n=1 Tax=Actinomadura litoris TaxID=2678616 RepID=A0A7K1LAT9_9ACTN|nr:DUF6221 family protein [Actinomadura litoris]MUN41433.1 hypothetical protein [Actinomadura litoris]
MTTFNPTPFLLDLATFTEARLDDEEHRLTQTATPAPAQALRDINAKRAIAREARAAHAQALEARTQFTDGIALGYALVLQNLAVIWDDHADYDPRWLPPSS